eukprot:6352694-Amphidinium_carterae.1
MLAEIFDYRAKQKVDEIRVADGVKLAVDCAKQKVDETRVADGVKLAVEIYSDSSAARAIAFFILEIPLLAKSRRITDVSSLSQQAS